MNYHFYNKYEQHRNTIIIIITYITVQHSETQFLLRIKTNFFSKITDIFCFIKTKDIRQQTHDPEYDKDKKSVKNAISRCFCSCGIIKFSPSAWSQTQLPQISPAANSIGGILGEFGDLHLVCGN